ncbi:hypothetical protein [Streptomyces niveus]|uniref:hypothetical protein n=1 Tax=Streptomyces niveus TaxID=193462 RepID=UPI00342BEE05
MASTTGDAARRRTGTLAVKIIEELWPHSATLKPMWARRHPDDLPARDLRLPVVLSTDEVAVDDLVLVYDERGRDRFDLLGRRTAREAVACVGNRRDTVVVARVVSKTERTLTVVQCTMPTGYWASCNLTVFGQVRKSVEPRTMRLNTGKRQIGLLGSAHRLRERVRNHPEFDVWKSAWVAAKVEGQAEEAELEVSRKARAEVLRPKREAVEFLNRVAGEEVVGWVDGLCGGPMFNSWLNEPGRLRTYVAGLNTVGTLTDDEYRTALGHLETLGR